MNIKRLYKVPPKSFFLFGARGVGKSTWIKNEVRVDHTVDLLNSKEFLQLQQDPSLLTAKTAYLKENSVVFIDEIQKLPVLLDEVHRLMEKVKLNFIMTGSSARKLKRNSANLLAGRAHTYKMFPFSSIELKKKFSLEQLLEFGSLPIVLRDLSTAEETLNSYVDTYLREEIREEALTRNLAGFSRFLSLSGNLNGQVLSFENIGRDTSVSGKTIQAWYEILEETLLGYKILPYTPGFKVREAKHSKFFWFDCAVARVASGLSWKDVDGLWKGFAFESIVLRELLTFLEYSRKRYPIYYYATPGVGEVDFLLETRPKTINRAQEFLTIEVKLSQKWKREFEAASRSLQAASPQGSHSRMIGVYLGVERLTFDGFEVYPFFDFIKQLFAGDLF